MATLLEEVAGMQTVERPKPQFASKTLFGAPPKTKSLDDVIVGARNDLVGTRVTKCVWCGGSMRPVRRRDSERVTGGRCRNCGTSLS